MQYSTDGLNILTAREQIVLPDSKEACRQDPGLEAGRLLGAGLGSSSTVQPPSLQRPNCGDGRIAKLQFPEPFCACPCKLQFPEPFKEPERMSVEIDADDFCIIPCTTEVLAALG